MSDILITTYVFKQRQYLIKMNHGECLDLVLTDKQTGEEWECSHDVTYIENLTRKTGNFKQFKIFVTMLKSGLLKTSECISLDLYTYNDFEPMRLRKIRSNTKLKNNIDSNRRYLVLTYSVEFDKINYPLPLNYCGPPDPSILQAAVRKLEVELSKAKEELNYRHCFDNKKLVKPFTKRIDALREENFHLNEEVKRLTKLLSKNPKSQVQVLQKAVNQLERSIKCERSSHHKLVEKLQNDKDMLAKQLEHVKSSEKMLKVKLNGLSQNRVSTNHNDKYQAVTDDGSQLQKGSSLKTREGYMSYRSRSASPRITNSEYQHNDNKKRSKSKPQSRTRSNSLSSKKESLSDMMYYLQVNGSNSKGASRASSPISRSNSISTLSHSSFGNALLKTGNSKNSKRTQKTKSFENHLNKLIKNYM